MIFTFSTRQEKAKSKKCTCVRTCFYLNLQAIWDWIILCLTFYTAIMVNFTIMWIEMILQICFNIRQIIPIHHPKLSSQVPFNVALKNKTSEDVSLLVIDSIVDGNWTFSLSPTDRWPLLCQQKFLKSLPNIAQFVVVLQYYFLVCVRS